MNGDNGNAQAAMAAYHQGIYQQQAYGYQYQPTPQPPDPKTAIQMRIGVLRDALAKVDAQRTELDRLERMLVIAEEK